MNASLVSQLEHAAALAASPRIGTLIVLLVAAAAIDCRIFRIPNWLTAGGAIAALLLSVLLPEQHQTGFLLALGGLGTALALLLPMYALGIMGAGDVKLMAMVGAFLGLPDTLYAVVFTFVAGGIAAVVLAVWRRALLRTALNVRDIVQSFAFAAFGGYRPAAPGGITSVGRLPYAISICVGTIASLASKQLGFA